MSSSQEISLQLLTLETRFWSDSGSTSDHTRALSSLTLKPRCVMSHVLPVSHWSLVELDLEDKVLVMHQSSRILILCKYPHVNSFVNIRLYRLLFPPISLLRALASLMILASILIWTIWKFYKVENGNYDQQTDIEK